METYRSGHNELDSKSSCPKGHVGSNPTVSALETLRNQGFFFYFGMSPCVFSIFFTLQRIANGGCGLLFCVIVDMRIDVCRSGEVRMSQPFLNGFHWNAFCH